MGKEKATLFLCNCTDIIDVSFFLGRSLQHYFTLQDFLTFINFEGTFCTKWVVDLEIQLPVIIVYLDCLLIHLLLRWLLSRLSFLGLSLLFKLKVFWCGYLWTRCFLGCPNILKKHELFLLNLVLARLRFYW